MRVLHVGHHQIRKYGNIRVSWTQKLFFGLIRNGHCVQPFSDRDVAAFEAPLGIRDLGGKKANQRLVQTANAFEPDVVIVGHCDIIQNETLEQIRREHPNVILIGANNDPLFVPDNCRKISDRCAVVDAMFVSSGEKELGQFRTQRAKLFHMPNPVDSSIESFDVTTNEHFDNDLVFCSKATDNSTRAQYVNYLKENLDADIRFATPGNFGQPGVWGRDYDHFLSRSKMGLNLNRQEGFHWYSSARMAQLVGNGLLTFTHASADFAALMPEETLVYFDNQEELIRKINDFNSDDAKRIHWARNAREFFHREINSTLYAQYIIEAGTETPYSHDYIWANH